MIYYSQKPKEVIWAWTAKQLTKSYLTQSLKSAIKKLEISHQIDKFVADLQSSTCDPDDFITITQLEEKLSLLRSNTTKTYSDILSAYLSSMDETELIKRKKGNTEKRG